jgi:X-linked retinitis pigmentosa GTPase regulator
LGLCHKKRVSPSAIKISFFDSNLVKKIAASSHSAAVSKHGELFVWGTGTFGEFLEPKKFLSLEQEVTEVSLGFHFGIAIDKKGETWSWGLNENGELGLGDNAPRSIATQVLSLKKK